MQVPEAVLSLNDTMAVPQVSVAESVAAVGIASHSTVMLAGKVSLKVGLPWSSTVMVCTWTVSLSHSSVAVHVLVMV